MKASVGPINGANGASRLVDLRALRAFIVVAHEGNVSRAANLLHLSQPAVSLQLKKLEDQLGLELFSRTANGLALSSDGAALLPAAERALAALADFGEAARRLTGTTRGQLRIGTIVDPEFIRLGAFLRELKSLAPELDPELRQGMSGTVANWICKGELDVGFCLGSALEAALSATPQDTARALPELYETVLAELTYKVVAPPGWESRVLGADWATLALLPWIDTPAQSVHHRLLNRVLGAHALQKPIAVVDQEASMLALVRAGAGLSLARESAALHERHVNGLVIADKVALDVPLTFVCLAAKARGTAVKAALEAVHRAWQISRPVVGD